MSDGPPIKDISIDAVTGAILQAATAVPHTTAIVNMSNHNR